MKRIKLYEHFFDDVYDINNSDLDIEITDKFMNYKVGDIYYKNKKPYAICCGDENNFLDNNPRFVSLSEREYLPISHHNFNIRLNNKTLNKHFDFQYKDVNMKKINHLDEDGYKNTLLIKQLKNINKYPAFYNCFKKSDDFYIPAIDELLILLYNLNIINPIIEKYNGSTISESSIDKEWDVYWSSTQSFNKKDFLVATFIPQHYEIFRIFPFNGTHNYNICFFVNL